MRYDADGNLRFATDFNGKTTEFQYDAMNCRSSDLPKGLRLTLERCRARQCLRFRIPDASLGEVAVEWRYTASGQRERMIDGHGVTLYGYDDRDRLQTKTSPEGVVTYGYDNGSDVTSIAIGTPQGASVTYGYDHLNRLQTVTDVNQQVTTYGYDENGNLGNVALPNGLSKRRSSPTPTASSPRANGGWSRKGQAGPACTVTTISGGSPGRRSRPTRTRRTARSATPTTPWAIARPGRARSPGW